MRETHRGNGPHWGLGEQTAQSPKVRRNGGQEVKRAKLKGHLADEVRSRKVSDSHSYQHLGLTAEL